MHRCPSHVSHVRAVAIKISVRRLRVFRALQVNIVSQMSVLQLVKLMHVLHASTVSTSCRLAEYNAPRVNLADSVTATPMHHNSAQAANRTPFRTPKDSMRVSLVVLASTQPVQWRRRRALLRLRLLRRHHRQRPRHQRQLRTPRHKLAHAPLVVAEGRFV